MTEDNSNSLEEDEIIRSIMDYNFPKLKRPKSHIFPKTPELGKKVFINSLKSSKKPSPIISPKPRTTRNSIISIKTPEEINSLSKKTSKQIIKSVYTLVSSKLPCNLYGSSELSDKDQEEIQNFFVQKKTQFKKLLEEISEKSIKNSKKFSKDSMRSSQFPENKYLDEIKRIQIKQKQLKKELIKKTNERIIKEKGFLKKNTDIEVKKKKTEIKKIQKYEKDLIIKNIDNFYKDKINLVKDYFQRELETKKIQSYEEKKFIAELVKEQKQIRINKYSHLKQKYEQQIEELKEKFDSIC